MHFPERRRTYRIVPEELWAVLIAEKAFGRYLVEDLSQRGALVRGGPPLSPETALTVELLLPDREPLTLDGKVIRRQRGGRRRGTPSLAVHFTAPSVDAEESLQDYIVGLVLKELGPRVLIGCSRERERSALATTVKALGCSPISVGTALELLLQLESSGGAPQAVILGSYLEGGMPADIGRYLAQTHPSIRRVLVSRPGWRPHVEAAEHFHKVTPKPWTQEDLGEALCLRC